MQSKIYNNPLFSQGLARLVESYMPNPEREMRMADMEMRQKLNQQRYDMNEAKMDGSLGAMVGRSMGGGGKSGGRAPAASPAPAASRPLTQSELSRAAALIKQAGYEGAEAATLNGALLQRYEGGGYPTLDAALADLLPNVTKETVEVSPETHVWGDGDGGLFGDYILDAFRGDPAVTKEQLVIPPAAVQAAPTVGQPTMPPAAAALLEQARAAIAAGADPAQVAERLKANGVDPSQM